MCAAVVDGDNLPPKRSFPTQQQDSTEWKLLTNKNYRSRNPASNLMVAPRSYTDFVLRGGHQSWAANDGPGSSSSVNISSTTGFNRMSQSCSSVRILCPDKFPDGTADDHLRVNHMTANGSTYIPPQGQSYYNDHLASSCVVDSTQSAQSCVALSSSLQSHRSSRDFHQSTSFPQKSFPATTSNQENNKEVSVQASSSLSYRSSQNFAIFTNAQHTSIVTATFGGTSVTSSPILQSSSSFCPIRGNAGDTPNHNDVLFGRGGMTNRHPGNIEFRSLVERYGSQYAETQRGEKRNIAKLIVRKVRKDLQGRFLKRALFREAYDGAEDLWHEVPETEAVAKTLQLLREVSAKRKHKGVVVRAQLSETKSSTTRGGKA